MDENEGTLTIGCFLIPPHSELNNPFAVRSNRFGFPGKDKVVAGASIPETSKD